MRKAIFIFVIMFTALLCFLGFASKKQYDKIGRLNSQIVQYKDSREKMCERVLSIFEGAVAVANQKPFITEDSQRLCTDLLEVGAYAEGCVALPDTTKKAMEGCQNGGVDESLLKEGVWSLDKELRASKSGKWPIQPQQAN